jgi:hypothetical protein
MWNKIFNIVICCLSPLYLVTKATKAICPLCLWMVLSDGEVKDFGDNGRWTFKGMGDGIGER